MGLGDFLKKIALPVAGIALGGPILGALGGLGGGAAGGGLGGLIGAFQTSGIGKAIGPIMQGVGLFSSVRSGNAQIEQAELANRIQAANTLEAIKFFPIKERALLAEEKALASGFALESEQLTEQRARLSTALGFQTATLERDSGALGEKFRQLAKQEEQFMGAVAASAASRGIRVSSEQIKLQEKEITRESEFARGQLTLQLGQLDQNRLELQQQFEDALFDAGIQEKINLRSQSLGQERIDFEREMNIEREKTARHIAALQGITIPGEGPKPETPEEKADRERRQREESERIRSNIDANITQPGGPMYGGKFYEANVFGQNISGFAGTTSDFGTGGGFNPQTGGMGGYVSQSGGGYSGGLPKVDDPFGDYGNE